MRRESEPLENMKPIISEIFSSSFCTPDGSYLDEISPREIDLLFQNRLLKAYLPKEMNGLDLSLTDTLSLIREASFINGSLGWLIQIGNGGAYFASCFEEEKAKELFRPENAVIAGSGTPSGAARKVGGGFQISGKWPFCSGADYATLFTITFIDPVSGEKCAAVVPSQDVIVHSDWKTIGLKHTSTHTIELKDVFISEENTFNVLQQFSFQDHESFSLPFVIYAQAFFLQVVLGAANRIVLESEKIIREKGELWNKVYPSKIERLSHMVEQIDFVLRSCTLRTEEITRYYQDGGDHNEEENDRSELVHYAKKIREMIHELVGELGIAVIYEDHVISIFYRDLLVASQHYLLNER